MYECLLFEGSKCTVIQACQPHRQRSVGSNYDRTQQELQPPIRHRTP